MRGGNRMMNLRLFFFLLPNLSRPSQSFPPFPLLLFPLFFFQHQQANERNGREIEDFPPPPSLSSPIPFPLSTLSLLSRTPLRQWSSLSNGHYSERDLMIMSDSPSLSKGSPSTPLDHSSPLSQSHSAAHLVLHNSR